MSKTPKRNDKKTERQEKLAAALRANLHRRKAAKQESRKATKQESRKAAKSETQKPAHKDNADG